jgi:hypothetical protein
MSSPSGHPGTRWKLACAALVIPFTAMLHHGVFVRSTCMLNNFGEDYSPSVVKLWLKADPSLPWAIVAAMVVFTLGNHERLRRWARASVPPFLVAFAPLSLWIWDVPFAGRPVCHHFHDNRLVLPGAHGAVRAPHIYGLGLVLFVLMMALRSARKRRSDA